MRSCVRCLTGGPGRGANKWIGYFPRLILLLPHIIVLSILLATHPSLRSAKPDEDEEKKPAPTTPPAQAGEGSVDWLANVQAIQNLMGVL